MVYARMHWDVIRMAYAPSWKLLELSFPWGFAAGAMLIAMFKLAQSLYYDFPFVRQLLTA